MSVGEFLERVVTTDEGWFLLAVQHQKKWLELWFRWPSDLPLIIKTIHERREQFDLHFTSHLFSEKHSDKKYVLPTRTIQADLDDADINNLPVQPTVLVTTSPNRYQGYWVLSQCLPQSELESLSRKLTYNIPRCDHAGWPLAHRQRLPDSLSHKYEETHEVKIVSFVDEDNVNPYSIQALNDVEYTEREADDEAWVNTSLRTYPVGPYELLQSIKDKLPQAVYNQYDVPQPDRSAALWALECAAFRAGLDRDAVFHLAKHSANNKFDALQFNADRELSKDVMRAFKEVKSGARDARGIINEARRLPGTLSERRQYIQRLVHGFMQETGEFVHTIDDQVWYIDHETGKPMYLSENSQQLRYLLDVRFGLNNTETDQRFVASGITAQVASIPPRAIATSLSHYDRDAAALYIHTGKRDVIKVTKSEVTKIANGTAGIVFQWLNSTDAFTLDPTPIGSQWCEIVFGKSVNHVVGLPRDQALAVLRVWTLFLLFKNASVSRPILAIFGQPGCLAANTQLLVKRGGHSPRSYSIETLYKMMRGGRNGPRTWDLSIPTKLPCMLEDEGVTTYKEIDQVVYSGEKQTYTVKIGDKLPFRVTVDHLFRTISGYKKLSDLSVGDKVVVEGPVIESTGRNVETRTVVTAHYHPCARIKVIAGRSYGSILRCRAMIEAHLNQMTPREFLRIVSTDKDRAATLIYLPKDVHIHHRDEHPSNDSLDNLLAMMKGEHDQHHGYKNTRNLGYYSGMFTTVEAEIVSIEPYGIEPTYDIVMKDDENPNFCVNGVVVHNSGKSTIFRKLYALLYGARRSVSTVTTPDSFDMTTVTDPFVALDNVDSWEKWLPDRLAQAASSSEIGRRKLWTDGDMVYLRRNAMIAVSAHAPKFGREDVLDRLLLLTLERLETFSDENEIVQEVLNKRNQIWYAIVNDVQRVLNTPYPEMSEAPQFRIADFARMGYWIALGVGIGAEFKAAINTITKSQKVFSLDEDSLLVNTVAEFVKKSKHADDWMGTGELWSRLETYCPDPPLFKKLYQNSQTLGKKLWVLQDALKELFIVEHKIDASKGARVWRINARD